MIRVQETALYLQNSLIIKCDHGYLILLELFGLEKNILHFLACLREHLHWSIDGLVEGVESTWTIPEVALKIRSVNIKLKSPASLPSVETSWWHKDGAKH